MRQPEQPLRVARLRLQRNRPIVAACRIGL